MAANTRSKCHDISSQDLASILEPFAADGLQLVNYAEDIHASLDAAKILKAKVLLKALKAKIPALLLKPKTVQLAMSSFQIPNPENKMKQLKSMLYRINQTRVGVPWIVELWSDQCGQKQLRNPLLQNKPILQFKILKKHWWRHR